MPAARKLGSCLGSPNIPFRPKSDASKEMAKFTKAVRNVQERVRIDIEFMKTVTVPGVSDKKKIKNK